MSGTPDFPLDSPVRPFAVRIPKAPAVHTSKGSLRAVIYSDTHVPFHDKKALNVVRGIIQEVKPHILLNGGDLVDCWQISRFDKDPTRKDSLQDNIDEAREHLAEFALVARKARRVLLAANHDDRLTKTIWGLEGAARELPKLRIFQKHMTWPSLLELDSIGWEWVPTAVQSRTPILPHLVTKHGTVVRKWSGATARGEWERYGKSGISGHTHRLSDFEHRDHSGTATWIETGCTCDLNPSYGTDFDWMQGCVVITWNKDRRLMQPEIVSIREGMGQALYRGKVIG